jgi:hypothetical protein
MLTAFILAAALSHLPASMQGDFDFDGKPDVAEFVPSSNGGYNLIIRRGATDHPDVVIKTFAAQALANLYLDVAKSGHYETWCGKGGGAEDDPCPYLAVDLKGGELMFGYEEASTMVVIWTGTAFEPILISD